MDYTNQNPIIHGSILASKWFNPEYLFDQGVIFIHKIYIFFQSDGGLVLGGFHNLLFFVNLFFLIIISYTSVRLFEIRHKEHKHLEHELKEYAHHHAHKQKALKKAEEVSKNPRWVKTLSYLLSEHESDWKLSVMEADAMLEDLMEELGFKGDNLGEKLKGATQEKFRHLTSAWEAHTVRNRIAHEGAYFTLTQREAKRLIAIYESIFREYGFI